MKWLKTVGAFFVALAGLFFAYQYTKHNRAAGRLENEAAELETDKVEHVAGARQARTRAEKAQKKANDALKAAETRITKLKENGHEKLADRVDAFNKRMRDD